MVVSSDSHGCGVGRELVDALESDLQKINAYDTKSQALSIENRSINFKKN